MSLRPVKDVRQSVPTMEGAGVALRRAFGFGNTSEFDPFLLLDDFRNDNPERVSRGLSRGIRIAASKRSPTCLQARVEHGDSLGNRGQMGAGDVQWMTAGSGILHQEMPKGDPHGRMHGFQLWSNLPSSLKMTKPRYQDIPAGDIPEVTDDDGTRVRVIIGDFWGKSGPVEGVAADPRYLDVSVPPGKTKRLAVDRANNAFAYVFAGSGSFRDASNPQAVATEVDWRHRMTGRSISSPIDRSCSSIAATRSSSRPATKASASCWSRASPRGTGRVARPDRDEHELGAAAGLRGAARRNVHQVTRSGLPDRGAALVAGGRKVGILRRDVAHVAPGNQIEGARRHRRRRRNGLQGGSIGNRLARGHSHFDRHRLVARGADVDAMGPRVDQSSAALGAEVLRQTHVIAIGKNLRSTRLDIQKEPARREWFRFGRTLRRRFHERRRVEPRHRPVPSRTLQGTTLQGDGAGRDVRSGAARRAVEAAVPRAGVRLRVARS